MRTYALILALIMSLTGMPLAMAGDGAVKDIHAQIKANRAAAKTTNDALRADAKTLVEQRRAERAAKLEEKKAKQVERKAEREVKKAAHDAKKAARADLKK
jgi:hypothetical protein